MSRRIVFALLVAATVMVASPAHAGGGGCAAFTTGAGTEVVVSHNCFQSTVTHVDVGDTVTWTNEDSWQHNLVTPAFRGSDDLTTHAVTFDRPGVYPYVCTIHWGMVGAVVVGDADAPAAAGAQGQVGAASERAAPVAVTLAGAGIMLGVGVWLGRGRATRMSDRVEG